MYTLLQRKNEGLKDDLLKFTQTLIQTASPSFKEGEVAKLVKAKMTEVGFDKVETDEFGNVVGIIFGREAEPTVLLNSHMDTVETGELEEWSHSPNSGAIENGMIYGAGASDCKGGLSAQIYAGALLKSSLLPLRGNLIVAATVSEERGGSPGVRFLMEKTLPSLDLKPTYAILGEPTGLSLYRGHDGFASFDIVVRGMNEFQVNDATEAIFNNFRARNDLGNSAANQEDFKVKTPRFQYVNGMRRGTLEFSQRMHKSDTIGSAMEKIKHDACAAAALSVGVAVDVVVPKEKCALYTKQTTIVEKRIDAWSIDPYHPMMERARQALSAAGCAVTCGKWSLPRLGMGTAGGLLTRDFKVPTIGYGPGIEELSHAINESVEAAKVVQASYGTAAIVHSLVGIPVCGWTSDEI